MKEFKTIIFNQKDIKEEALNEIILKGCATLGMGLTVVLVHKNDVQPLIQRVSNIITNSLHEVTLTTSTKYQALFKNKGYIQIELFE